MASSKSIAIATIALTSCHPKNEPLIATREEGEEAVDPLQMNGVSTNSRLRQHLRGVGSW